MVLATAGGEHRNTLHHESEPPPVSFRIGLAFGRSPHELWERSARLNPATTPNERDLFDFCS
jgi:hypothetical protein